MKKRITKTKHQSSHFLYAPWLQPSFFMDIGVGLNQQKKHVDFSIKMYKMHRARVTFFPSTVESEEPLLLSFYFIISFDIVCSTLNTFLNLNIQLSIGIHQFHSSGKCSVDFHF